MLTRSDERFIKSWSEQKDGSKWKFYLQYIIAWGVVIFLILFFLLKLIVANVDLGKIEFFLIILPSSIILAAVITHIVYTTNERKLKILLEKHDIPDN